MPRDAPHLSADMTPSSPTATAPSPSTTQPKPAKLKPTLVADLFCGAGGSSTGAKRALQHLGLQMELLCVNHWPTAIDTHTKNHPDARHYCQDVSTVRPHLVIPEGRLDLLMASPTCTYHSRARGGKPISDQQRMDPWHVIAWLTELRVKRLIIENVPEFVRWGPCNPRTGKPIKSREGEYFLRWVETIRSLGFDVDFRILNAANFGDATTRERFFLIARSDKGRLRWPDATHAPRQSIDRQGSLLGPALKPWRAAREIIDWNIDGRSIFNRPIPLSPRTLERILAGALKLKWPELYIVAIEACALIPSLQWALERASKAIANGVKGKDLKRAEKMLDYGRPRLLQLRSKHIDLTPVRLPAEGEAMTVVLRNHMDGQAVSEPLPTVTAGGTHVGIAQPMLFQVNQGQGRKRNLRSVDDPVPTVMTRPSLGVAEPIVLTVAHGNLDREKNADGRRARSADEPLGSITAGGGQFGVAEPLILKQHFRRDAQSTEQPVPTVTGVARIGLVESMVLNRHGDNGGRNRTTTPEEPLPTVTAAGGPYLIEPKAMVLSGHAGGAPRETDDPMPGMTGKNNGPFIVSTRQHTGGPAPRSTDRPLPTLTATDSRLAVVKPMLLAKNANGRPEQPISTIAGQGDGALIAPYYGEGSGKTGQAVTEPVPTITTKGRFGLVVPVTNSGGGPEPRSTDEPLPTMTTAKGGEFAMVTPVTHDDASTRARSPEDPLPTITCAPRGDLAFIAASFGERDGQKPRIHTLDQPMPTLCAEGRVQLVQPGKDFDILFRMLEPHELASAMGFNEQDQQYEFTGTKTDVIKQIGNAVPCNTAAALVRALFDEERR
jgi:DNA (cytosine-5)-methyltransferase 1